MEILKIVILSVLAWQVLSCIAITINEAKGTYFAVCIPAFICEIIGLIYRKFRVYYAKRNYILCYLYKTGRDGKSVSLWSLYCTRKQYEKFYHEGENDYYIKFYRDGSTFKSAPFKNEVYHGQESFCGYSDFKKKFVKS